MCNEAGDHYQAGNTSFLALPMALADTEAISGCASWQAAVGVHQNNNIFILDLDEGHEILLANGFRAGGTVCREGILRVKRKVGSSSGRIAGFGENGEEKSVERGGRPGPRGEKNCGFLDKHVFFCFLRL